MSEGCIDWPGFARRIDFISGLSTVLDLRVSARYAHGFDARDGSRLYYFSADLPSLHPMGFWVPQTVIENIPDDANIRCEAGRLSYFAGAGRSLELIETAPIGIPAFCETFDQKIVRQNLHMLLSSLKLFGRSSIVRDLILGCNTAKNILSGAEAMLMEPEPDLERLIAYVGVGEGLTPAFDDFLCGMLLADRFASLNCIRIPDNFMMRILDKTTMQAWQQFEFACAGRLSLRFENYLAALLTRPVKSAETVKLLDYGHSSGTDILCGVWHHLNRLLT